MNLWTFKTKNFVVKCYTQPDTLDTSYMEPELAEECRQKIKSREWKCFQTTVEVKHRLTGEVLAESFLGGSIYADPKDFYREHIGIRAQSRRDGMNYGCYFTDMVREACRDARTAMIEKRQRMAEALNRLNNGIIKTKEI